MKTILASILFLTLLLSACTPQAQTPAATQSPEVEQPALAATATSGQAATPAEQDWESERWYDDAVFYEIFVRSFYDSDGDGIGDLQGVIQKLDYLNDGDPTTNTDLGVTALWLMPIFPSPSYHGYDVTDYYSVNPDYGTMEDLQALLDAAHARGMRVIIDFVINHTSDLHSWFRAAADGDPQYRDYYIWSSEDPGYLGPSDQDVWHPKKGSYYYGVFYSGMPDLNFRNPAVTEEVRNIASFWLKDVGVDGFRVDGARHLIEEGELQENTPETLAWFQDFRQYYKSIAPNAFAIGEVWSSSTEASLYVEEGAFDMVFNFSLAEDMLAAANSGNAGPISNSLAFQKQEFGDTRYAAFLSNHDQTRVMTRLNGDVNKAKAAASLLLTSPGTPFIYYGEEIGMTGDKPDEIIRKPMQWSNEPLVGFTTGKPWIAPNSLLEGRTVSDNLADTTSLLHHYQSLIRIRQEHDALRTGNLIKVLTSERKLFGALRVAESESVLVLINLSDEALNAASVGWSQSGMSGAYQPTLLMGEGQLAELNVTDKGLVNDFVPLPEIPAHSTIIIQYLTE